MVSKKFTNLILIFLDSLTIFAVNIELKMLVYVCNTWRSEDGFDVGG